MKILMSFMFSASLVLAAVPPAAAARPDVVIPFEQANGAIFIQVVVAGRPLWFIFDTGDKYAVIDLPVARALGLGLGPPIAAGGAGSATVTGNMVAKGDVRVMGLDGFSQPLFVALPMEGLSRAEGREVDGLLGQDFIRRFVVDIDYAKQTLTLHDPSGYHYTGVGHALDISFSAAGLPLARARVVDVAGHPADGAFVVDTGSTGALILNTPFVAQNHFRQPGQATVPLQDGAGVGGGLNGETGRVSALDLAGFSIARPYAVFAQAASGVFAAADVQGNIGAQILRKFKVTLDDADELIYLEPAADFAEPLAYDMSGVTIIASGVDYRTFAVTSVLPGSAGAAAGVESEDKLIEVAGRPAADYSLSDLRALLRRPGTVEIEVERNGSTRALSLILRPQI